ncbi:MAG TPA: PilZ domain-containing protein [Candidatus Baltobacteraceae bacterium]|jgi:hypothetical protein|nr:PilZ domain-containing protein [Candidatus Baltobacteraceae bacterium]
MIFRSLFGANAKKATVPEEKLPVLHSFVDVTVTGRQTRSVPVEEVGGRGIVVGDVLGRAGERASFVYETPMGRFRFGATIVAVRGNMTVFEAPARVEAIAGGSQKRSSVRLDVLVVGSWRFAPGGNGVGEFVRGNIRDISRGGCALIMDRQCKVGQMLEVRLNLRPGLPPLTLLCEVMRTQQVPTSGKFSHGLRFHGLRAEEDHAILEFINNRLAELRSRGLA